MFRIDLIDKDKNTVKILPETLDQSCRLCLKENGTTNIFAQTLANNGKKYIDFISMLSIAQVQENDGLPTKICNTCATKLNDFYIYKEHIKTTQILLSIALGKVIVQPVKQYKYSENLNTQNEIITIDDDDEDDQSNFGSFNASSNVEKENVQEIKFNKNPNKIDGQTNTKLTFSKSSTGGSILHNILYEEIQNNNEDELEDTDSNITDCWKNDNSCISCNSNLNTQPGLKFYSFPQDPKMCNTWKKVLKLDKIEYISPATCHKHFRLCNRHFTPSMFYGKFKNKLRKTAIPTDFIEEAKIKLETDVQTQNVSPVGEILEEIAPNDLLCNETSHVSEVGVVPIEIADHTYTKKIAHHTKTKKEIKKKSGSSRYQCISFDEMGNKIYTCCFCSEKFEDRILYKKHKFKEYRKRKIRLKPKLACSMCGKLINRERMRDHMVTHGEERPHICDVCGKRYRSRSNLNDHKLIHKGIKPRVCELCGKSFYYLCQLKDHLQTHNPEPTFMCHICGYGCYSSQSLKRHENKHRLGKENFRQLRNGGRSTRNYNTVLTKKTECDICHKKFPHSSTLIIHMRVHTGERPFKCQDCGKSFQQRGQLDYHYLLHTGVKAYECHHCGKKFTLNGNLQQHIKTHTGDKPHQCDLCEKRFYTNSSLRKHKNVHKNNLEYKLF